MKKVDDFVSRLGIRHPIIQAPMVGVSTPALAAAVSDAGALGSLGIGAIGATQAKKMIQQTRALTGRPFSVNMFCHPPAPRDPGVEAAWVRFIEPLFAEMGEACPTQLSEIYTSFLEQEDTFEVLCEQRPAAVSFHFGIPKREWIDGFRSRGIVTMATATNLYEAKLIGEAGIDMIVAQGSEAGGHRGMFDQFAVDELLSTSVLVQLLARATPLPVVAAGGIMDGRGIRAMLALGASAVQLGTAFVLCPESSANGNYRRNLKSERAMQTRLTSVISGRPARGIVNRLIRHGEQLGAPPVPAYPVAYDVTKRLNAFESRHENHGEFAVQWAGQGATLARELPAADMVALLVEELRREMRPPNAV